MNVLAKLTRKWHRSGVRGVLAGALRRVAAGVDSKRTADNPEAKHSGADPTDHAHDFLTWVRFAVPGMLVLPNVDAMEHALANMPPGAPVLEIGSFCGLSTVHLSHLLDKFSPTSTLFTCDRWEFEGQRLGALLGDSKFVT